MQFMFSATICNSAQEALDLLDTREDEFDLVLGDVDLPDVDGFEFLQQLVHKTEIPVISEFMLMIIRFVV